jgi:phosphate-selective porin OprO/OprP
VIARSKTGARIGRGAAARFLRAGLLALGVLAPSALAAQDGDGPAEEDTLAFTAFDLGFTTLHYGMGMLIDFATYGQDAISRDQVDIEPGFVLRDLRVLFRGQFRGGPGIAWQTGIMYDKPTNTLRFRMTGLRFPLPGRAGTIFVGRTKEGVSLNKTTVGYYGWTMERYAFSDAFLPILNDGVKWYGYVPAWHFAWTVGAFTDWIGHVENYSKDAKVLAGRFSFVSLSPDPHGSALHIGVSLRVADPADGVLQLRSRPESFGAPYFLDTGELPAESTRMIGGEAYYKTGAWLFGSEYNVARVRSDGTNDLLFHGGDAFVSHVFGSAHRDYLTTAGGAFGNVIPTHPWGGDLGALEAVLRFSYTDLTDGPIEGGRYWRITPTLNWHLSGNVRLELGYGYGVLDQLDEKGHTHFLQTRWQLQF